MKAQALFDLSGRVALVTGASSGLGHRFSRVLAANGATVICAARRRDRLDALVAEIISDGRRAHAVTMDVSDAESVGAGLDEATGLAGVPTIVCNNAGIAHAAAAFKVEDEDWRQVIDVNLDSVFRIARETARRMRDAGLGGSIINTASILGLRPSRGLGAYAVSKAAVVQLTGALAVEWGQFGIRVNALAPGYFATELNSGYLKSDAARCLPKAIPAGRIGCEGELDGALLLLASDASSFMTGAVVPVDGGHVLEVPTG